MDTKYEPIASIDLTMRVYSIDVEEGKDGKPIPKFIVAVLVNGQAIMQSTYNMDTAVASLMTDPRHITAIVKSLYLSMEDVRVQNIKLGKRNRHVTPILAEILADKGE